MHIVFDKFLLENGLKVIVHKDTSSPIVAVNIMYNVGSRDENPNKTGFAHLFEHLMFGGSINIPSYDTPLEEVGGDNNAFTSNDITNYYLTLPKENLETAFWLESDRMLSLNFSEKNLEVQRNVVIEEFRQRYLNQPYGDVWLLLRPLAYQLHPYSWDTIGKEVSHIENATLNDVKNFFYKHYAPNNAVLSVAGNVKTEQIKTLAEKWFAPIESRNVPVRDLPQEPLQEKARKKVIERDVPLDAIYKVYHMANRLDRDYHTADMISDIFAASRSSRLYQSLVKKQKLFNNIDAAISGSFDNGLFMISGHLNEGVDMKTAEQAIQHELDVICKEQVKDYELKKVKNRVETNLELAATNVLNKALQLAFFELLGNADNINTEVERYRRISKPDIQRVAKNIFKDTNSSTLYYYSLQQKNNKKK